MSGPPSFGEIAGLASRTLQKRRHNLRFLKYDEFDSNESALGEAALVKHTRWESAD